MIHLMDARISELEKLPPKIEKLERLESRISPLEEKIAIHEKALDRDFARHEATVADIAHKTDDQEKRLTRLLQAIRDYIKPKLAQFPLAVYGRDSRGCPIKREGAEEMRPCRVHLGSMPDTSHEAISAAPFIVVQPLGGHDEGNMQTIRAVLRVCIVAEDYEAAENDLLNLISQLRLWLLEMPGGAIGGGKYRLLPQDDDVLPWERPDEQVHPFLQAHIFTTWQTLGARKMPAPGMTDY